MFGTVKNNRMEQADTASHELHDSSALFSTGVNLTPMPSTVQGPRHLYGNKFFEQALPLVNREAPLVRSLNAETGRSWDWIMGEHLGVLRAHDDDEGAVVEQVTPDAMTLKRADGTRITRELYNSFPGNRKTLTNSYAQVKAGDTVRKGQTLASSNFTDNEGRMALGLNARIALVPYKGYSMDDAVVISQSFADRLKSMHAETVDREHDDTTTFGRDHFTSLFPKKYTSDQLAKLTDEGLPQPGQVFNPGDPLVLQTRPRSFSSNKSDISRMSRAQRFVRKDASLAWEGDYPATVLDVVKTKDKGHKILLQYEAGVGPGDKLTIRPGQKSYHPDTELFTDKGWKKIPDILNTDRVAALFDLNAHAQPLGRRARDPQRFVAKFVKPLHANTYVFQGDLYGLDATRAAYLVTGNHRIWRAGHMGASPRWYCQDAAEVDGTPQKFMTAVDFDLSERVDPEFFDLEQATHGVTKLPMSCQTRFPFTSWVEFMALYLSEGNVHHSVAKNHAIIITQKEREFCREFERVFDAMGMRWSKVNNQYLLEPNKALRRYLDQFGKAAFKFIPPEIKNASKETIRKFVSLIWQGDGDKDKGKEYYTASPVLAEDMRFLLTLLGEATSLQTRDKREHQNHDSHVVTVLDAKTTSTKKNYKDAFYREGYHGSVYCIQVPGVGVVLTRFRGKVMWNGNSTVSKIIPEDKMPRTADGKALEVLMNPLGLPSRENANTFYELMLGKIARKTGKPYVLPQFLPKGQRWNEFVQNEMTKHGVEDAEMLYDPEEDITLEQPVATGEAFVMKLHHQASKKMTARGQRGYSADFQPLKGQGQGAQRLSGLEMTVLHSSGARGVQKEAILLRGEQRDEYWQRLRANRTPGTLDKPFVWDKFNALLQGAGIHPREEGNGVLRLTPMTTKELALREPVEVLNDGIVDLKDFEPKAGGLFDPHMVRDGKWGYVKLKRPVVNPSYEETVRALLGLTKEEYEKILDGEDSV